MKDDPEGFAKNIRLLSWITRSAKSWRMSWLDGEIGNLATNTRPLIACFCCRARWDRVPYPSPSWFYHTFPDVNFLAVENRLMMLYRINNEPVPYAIFNKSNTRRNSTNIFTNASTNIEAVMLSTPRGRTLCRRSARINFLASMNLVVGWGPKLKNHPIFI